jgi:hypothetical protein
MFGNRNVELTASNLCAMEEVRLAFEVLLGVGIRFVGSLKISPSKIVKGEGFERRDLTLEATFVRLDALPSTAPQRVFVHKIELVKRSGGEWEACRIFFGFLSPSGDYRETTWYVAHPHQRPSGPASYNEVWVAQVHTDQPIKWHVGTSRTDRRTETGRLP